MIFVYVPLRCMRNIYPNFGLEQQEMFLIAFSSEFCLSFVHHHTHKERIDFVDTRLVVLHVCIRLMKFT